MPAGALATMRFGIVCALAAEQATLGASAGRWLDAHAFESVTCGPGQARARAAANTLLAAGCDVLVSWGLAGGLDPRLAAGDLVLARRIHALDDQVYPTDDNTRAAIIERLEHGQNVSENDLVSAAMAVTGAHDKQRWHARTGAAAVDMESGAIAAAAHAAGKACLVVRSIVDPAAFDVPPAALVGIDTDGRSHVMPVALELLRAPRQLPALLALAGHYRRGISALHGVAQRLNTA